VVTAATNIIISGSQYERRVISQPTMMPSRPSVPAESDWAQFAPSYPSDYRASALDSGVRSTVRPVMTLAVMAANRAMPQYAEGLSNVGQVVRIRCSLSELNL
jgi:hypothetical protein